VSVLSFHPNEERASAIKADQENMMANEMTADELNDWNRQIMDEFRANGGKVGGDFEGVPMVIVHHTGDPRARA
jgi:hypothetical protein